MYSFPCPNCSTPLRVRDVQRHTAEIQCPACSAMLTIQESNGKIIAQPGQVQFDLKSNVVPSPVRFKTLFMVLGGLVAGLLFFNYMQSSPRDVLPEPVGRNTPEQVETKPVVPSVDPSSVESLAEVDPLQQNLKKIAALIAAFRDEHGVFPNGRFLDTDESEAEFSWIAELMANQQAGRLSLAQDQSWNSPVNDTFVRRRIDFFQNSSIPKKVGADRYPASHFAGLSGVGSDAERLSKLHPRAGIFSPYRETQLADILDGAANTIMLVGINAQLGSWARPGTSTTRSFTQEPYLDGPDGIGTGQADSMLVLMADGSVKTISSKTSPIITRRMAAMADGLTLDLNAAGDPLKMEFRNDSQVSAKHDSDNDGLPLEPLFAPEPPLFDFNKSLEQKLKSYHMEQPRPLSLVLREFQEMLGAPLDWSLLEEDTLLQELQFSLEDVTLLQVLDQLTEKAGLKYSLEVDRIKLQQPAPR